MNTLHLLAKEDLQFQWEESQNIKIKTIIQVLHNMKEIQTMLNISVHQLILAEVLTNLSILFIAEERIRQVQEIMMTEIITFFQERLH